MLCTGRFEIIYCLRSLAMTQDKKVSPTRSQIDEPKKQSKHFWRGENKARDEMIKWTKIKSHDKQGSCEF